MPEEDNEQPSNIDPLTIGELLSLKEASEKSGFSIRYLQNIAKSGRLKVKRIGSQWVTSIASIEEYKRTRSHTLKKDL
jgi:hypothetical protein